MLRLWVWVAGGVHGLIGSAIFFATLRPLRDALSADALELKVQLMIAQRRPNTRWVRRV